MSRDRKVKADEDGLGRYIEPSMAPSTPRSGEALAGREEFLGEVCK